MIQSLKQSPNCASWTSILALAAVQLLVARFPTNAALPSFTPSEAAQRRLQRTLDIPPAYRAEALRVMIGEANSVSRQLQLPDRLPIEQHDIVYSFVAPPAIAQMMGIVGSITTTNYVYFMAKGNKFSSLERTDLHRERDALAAQYWWPISRIDTNSALELAIEFLKAASADVAALQRDCSVHVLPFQPRGSNSQHFVPVYWVWWEERDHGEGGIAQVEVLMPTRSIRQLSVNRADYLLRKPLVIKNAHQLLHGTNAAVDMKQIQPR